MSLIKLPCPRRKFVYTILKIFFSNENAMNLFFLTLLLINTSSTYSASPEIINLINSKIDKINALKQKQINYENIVSESNNKYLQENLSSLSKEERELLSNEFSFLANMSVQEMNKRYQNKISKIKEASTSDTNNIFNKFVKQLDKTWKQVTAKEADKNGLPKNIHKNELSSSIAYHSPDGEQSSGAIQNNLPGNFSQSIVPIDEQLENDKILIEAAKNYEEEKGRISKTEASLFEQITQAYIRNYKRLINAH